jgi:phospholipid/cholesterol/gamma-HCH transport system substrate-binding protein
MKRILTSACIMLGLGAFIFLAVGASNGNPAGTYKIELDNAFGLVTGADFKVTGVPVGTINATTLDQKTRYAVVTVSVNRGGFGSFHADAFCESRPESLIGEYFVDCDPGTSGNVLAPGSTIPVSHTQTTIPRGNVAPAVQLYQIFNALDPTTRRAFQVWQQQLAVAVRGNGQNLNNVLGNLPAFAADATDVLQVLDIQHTAVVGLMQNAGTVFAALDRDPAALAA